MGYLLKQSSTARPLLFLMVDSADHLTAKTGLSPTVTISKNGASFASPAGAVTEIGSGWYKVAGNATDTATLGVLALNATATGADPTDSIFEVVAFDPASATNLGLSNLDAAITSRGTSTLTQTQVTGGAYSLQTDGSGYVKHSSGTGTGQLDITSGVVKANTTQIAGSAVSTTSAQIGVSVVSYASGQAPLQPTTAGRTLDVTTTGEAGIDWANIGGKTTTNDLSGTTVGTATTIGATGIAAIWSYLKASAAAMATTTMGRFLYDQLSLLTSDTTVTTSIASDGAEITVYKGSTGELTLDVPYNSAADYDFTGRRLRLVFREIGSATCVPTFDINGTVSNAGTANQSVTFTWDSTDVTDLELSNIRGEALNAEPRYDYAYRWTVASLDSGDPTDSIIVARGAVKVICDDGASTV
jgi:hypothetical protein